MALSPGFRRKTGLTGRWESLSPDATQNVMSLKKTILTAAVLISLAAFLNAAAPGSGLAAADTAVAAASHYGQSAAPAVAGERGEPHGLSSAAETVFPIGPLPVTNSMLVTWIVALGLIVFAQMAMRNVRDVPGGAQNFWELMVESLYAFLESIVGPQLVKKTFWFFATIFIFILFTNWFGLIPGVGTVGWGEQSPHGFEVTRPLLRGGNANLNMTFAMATIFIMLWLV